REFSDFNVLDIYEEIIKLRMVKSRAEVKLIEQSIKLTRKALLSAQKQVKSGKYEYEVAAKFLYEIKRQNGILGFDTIVASGLNATILHYPTLNSVINENELVLLDLGGHNNMYTADISRTYPADKKFTKIGLAIYEIVLACNKAVIEYIKPGLTLLDLQEFTKDFLKRELVQANLLKEKDNIEEVYYHGVSHHLGLDTHDPGLRSLPLKVGNVITVEPGLYFAKHGIGVRIEDNVLVTAKGSKNLSRNIPKEVEDILK
ncbi:MAG TPA: M24 family metallopeptidase, partial [Bacilli bacterium]|nr:M24 family metallopeptidase [Bacilli bacterium]